jgi:succinoglycan biosynthesis transport protein ExoP
VAYAVDQQIINLHDDASQSAPNETESLQEKNLSALDSAYATAQAERIDAEAKWQQASNTPGMDLPQVLADPTIQTLSEEKAKLEAQYQDQMRLFRPGYPPALQLKAQIDELSSRIDAEAKNMKESLHETYQAAQGREDTLAAKVNQLKSSVLDLKDRSIKYNFLQREVDTNRTLYDGLLQRYKEVGVTGGVAANNVSVVDRAEAPLKPSRPKPLLNLALALMGGLGLGVLAAFGAEALDQAVRNPGDIEGKLGIPLLGAVPLLTKGVTPEEAMQDSRSTFWEAYYSIRTALQFSSTSGVPRSMVVVSARPGEGKTTTSIALSRSLARLGAKVLLVDADLRKPSLHTRFGVEAGRGLSNVLTGGASVHEVLQPTDSPSLSIITSGPLPPTPAELLADVRLRAFIAEAETLFDVVILDGPPIMGFADAPMIASAVSGTIVVVESGRTGRAQIRSGLRRLRMGHAKILGAVLAKYDVRAAAYGYGYGYGSAYGYYAYEYGDDDKKRKAPVANRLW